MNDTNVVETTKTEVRQLLEDRRSRLLKEAEIIRLVIQTIDCISMGQDMIEELSNVAAPRLL